MEEKNPGTMDPATEHHRTRKMGKKGRSGSVRSGDNAIGWNGMGGPE
jgi:hypothetical protein